MLDLDSRWAAFLRMEPRPPGRGIGGRMMGTFVMVLGAVDAVDDVSSNSDVVSVMFLR